MKKILTRKPEKKDRFLCRLLCCVLCAVMLESGICAAEEAGLSVPADHDGQIILEKDTEYCFETLRLLAHVPEKGTYTCMQGGGSDGTYAYYGMIDPEGDTILYKYDMSTWQNVACSEPLRLGHCNDISYDPVNGRLLIAHTGLNKVCYVDPDTLVSVGSEWYSIPIWRLEYLPDRHQLLTANNYTLRLFDDGETQNAAEVISCQGSKYTTQGLTSDGKYVYDVRWDSEQYEASPSDRNMICDYIVIHDLTGQFFGICPVYGLSGEPENMICLGNGTFAIGCNGSDSVYLVQIRKK